MRGENAVNFLFTPNEELEGTLHPQKFGCTPKNESKRVHVPRDEKPVGMLSNGQQYNQPQQYEALLCQTSNSNDQQYNQPQQYEPLLCQTSDISGQEYN